MGAGAVMVGAEHVSHGPPGFTRMVIQGIKLNKPLNDWSQFAQGLQLSRTGKKYVLLTNCYKLSCWKSPESGVGLNNKGQFFFFVLFFFVFFCFALSLHVECSTFMKPFESTIVAVCCRTAFGLWVQFSVQGLVWSWNVLNVFGRRPGKQASSYWNVAITLILGCNNAVLCNETAQRGISASSFFNAGKTEGKSSPGTAHTWICIGHHALVRDYNYS